MIGVSYTVRGMHTLLKRLGFTYKKNRLMPGKADPEAQRQFVLWFEKVRIELLKLLRAKHPGDGKIYLILDNASYNKALRVRDQAAVSQITLKHQPPYSPNLNLAERLWKFMRRKLFKDKYRSTFAKFKEQVNAFFADLDKYRDELLTLLTEKFQLVPAIWQAPDMA